MKALEKISSIADYFEIKLAQQIAPLVLPQFITLRDAANAEASKPIAPSGQEARLVVSQLLEASNQIVAGLTRNPNMGLSETLRFVFDALLKSGCVTESLRFKTLEDVNNFTNKYINFIRGI